MIGWIEAGKGKGGGTRAEGRWQRTEDRERGAESCRSGCERSEFPDSLDIRRKGPRIPGAKDSSEKQGQRAKD